MNRIFIILSTLSICAVTRTASRPSPGWGELTIRPSTTTKTDMQISLLPREDELTDTDAAPLYKEAKESLPDESELMIFNEWHDTLPDQLPAEEVEAELQKLKPSLDLIKQAAFSKQCNWGEFVPGPPSPQVLNDISKYRRLAYIFDALAKLQISQGQYDQAIQTIKTSLSMAKHISQAPTLTEGLVGIAIAALNLNRIEQLIQSPESPNLYQALQDVNLPLVDISNTMKLEINNLQNYNFLVRRQLRNVIEPAHDNVRKLMNRLDRRITTLQCIEAIRLYAGSHEGRLPDKLSDVTDYEIPNDPVTEKPLEYKSTGTEAVLTIEGTENPDGRDAVQYEIIIKEQ